MSNLATMLDAILSPEIIFENTEGVVFNKSEWLSATPEIVHKLATTTSKPTFKKYLKMMAVEVGDSSVLKAIEDQDPWVYKQARREALRYAPEVIAKTPSKLLPAKLRTDPIMTPRPEKLLGMSKDQIEQYYAQRRELIAKKIAKKADKKYFGDDLYGIFLGDKLIKGGFQTEEDAEIDLLEHPDKYDDTEDYRVQAYENPKSLSKLRETFLPLQHGWTVDEVVGAMMPYLYKIANKFKSLKTPREDLVQQGVIGVLNALRTDKGESPITAHALRHARGQMMHLAVTGGVIASGGRQAGEVPQQVLKKAGMTGQGPGSFQQKGGLLGYNVIWFDQQDKPHYRYFGVQNLEKGKAADPGYHQAKKFKDQLQKDEEVKAAFGPQEVRGSMASMSAPAGEQGELGDLLKGTKTKSPTYISRQADLVDQLISKADLSEKQEQLLRLAFGFDVPQAGIRGTGQFEPETEPREPGQQAGVEPEKGPKSREAPAPFSRGFKDIAKIAGISPQRARQQVMKAMTKICKTAEGQRSKFCQKLLGMDQGPKTESVDRQRILESAQQLMLIEDYIRNKIIKWIIDGELNTAFTQ